MNGTATATIGSTPTGKRGWKTRWRWAISAPVACWMPLENQPHAIRPLNTKTGKLSIPRSRIVENTNTNTASCASWRTTGQAQPSSVKRCIDATCRWARWVTTSKNCPGSTRAARRGARAGARRPLLDRAHPGIIGGAARIPCDGPRSARQRARRWRPRGRPGGARRPRRALSAHGRRRRCTHALRRRRRAAHRHGRRARADAAGRGVPVHGLAARRALRPAHARRGQVPRGDRPAPAAAARRAAPPRALQAGAPGRRARGRAAARPPRRLQPAQHVLAPRDRRRRAARPALHPPRRRHDRVLGRRRARRRRLGRHAGRVAAAPASADDRSCPGRPRGAPAGRPLPSCCSRARCARTSASTS